MSLPEMTWVAQMGVRHEGARRDDDMEKRDDKTSRCRVEARQERVGMEQVTRGKGDRLQEVEKGSDMAGRKASKRKKEEQGKGNIDQGAEKRCTCRGCGQPPREAGWLMPLDGLFGALLSCSRTCSYDGGGSSLAIGEAGWLIALDDLFGGLLPCLRTCSYDGGGGSWAIGEAGLLIALDGLFGGLLPCSRTCSYDGGGGSWAIG